MKLKIPKDFLLKNTILDGNDLYKNGYLEIDDCIADEIEDLWDANIHTLGCCCGHGKERGFIQVERTDFQNMLDLGYEWYRDYPEDFGGKDRFDAFVPKSRCFCRSKNKKEN